ncbi:probable sodium/metabolite cotransporter BASS3, chloroplastic isoform X1 [Dioscorea cayenensis subsp. rotundata]|uniref:Probable sodium/metabolite cotransporter BASS3, chloroplastic isoform X1 n=1 Tax=Dioscorea cayennensis subsp. rotundata TaxID=55577 RepID=A0AB40C2B6_DIOCR|nr:probable sodium/metabolite cotransporter BASS3, chloroplastic isoform X1 [Dioscorea cayenensis subsp. rotundata]
MALLSTSSCYSSSGLRPRAPAVAPLRNILKSGSLQMAAVRAPGSLRASGGGRRGWVSACSTSFPCLGRVGWHRREGNVSLLSFGLNSDSFLGGGKSESSSEVFSAMLPFVVAATAVAALTNPNTFSWVSKEYYAPALGGIMLSIGIKLSIDDFALAFKRPLPLSIGYIAQYVFKPLLGLLIARAFRTPSIFYAGFILTCCVSGAQLSSYASFLSKGDVALSILLTSSTTISSVLMTPLLTGLLIGSVVPVDGVAMSKSILQVVLLPIAIGLLLNTFAKSVVTVIQPIMPFVAMFCTSLCIGSPLSINRSQILSSDGLRLLFPVLTFHLVAFTGGYWLSRLPFFRQEEEASRTISLCTGMQSSTLAGLLATQFLGSSHAVPAACSVVAMAIMGLCIASFWGGGSRIRDLVSPLLPKSNTHSDSNS